MDRGGNKTTWATNTLKTPLTIRFDTWQAYLSILTVATLLLGESCFAPKHSQPDRELREAAQARAGGRLRHGGLGQ